MARGWESKAVEAQQDEANRERRAGPLLTDAQRRAASRRHTLELTRARAIDDLSRATAPSHRRMLEQAITALDDQLAGLES
ncbi:MAG TPA: hypothetical protein VLD67_03910 [Vicinamibacterales bacterium]|nr:hypothetical protein [Vicinamibacterales bacterium]